MITSLSCHFPLKGFYTGKVNPTGKRELIVTSYKVDHLERDARGYNKVYDSFVSPYAKRVLKDYDVLPCGKCIACRLRYSYKWANRMMLEVPYHENNYFVTLTYDNNNLQFGTDVLDADTGEISSYNTLVFHDIQLFLKRLRMNLIRSGLSSEFKYYLCGEYGDRTFRPHYHICFFGLDLPDLQVNKELSKSGKPQYTSTLLEKSWSNDLRNNGSLKGLVRVSELNWNTCSYTARYVMKKQVGLNAQIYEELGIEKPFVSMSTKPAIGKQYFDEHRDEIYNLDRITISTPEGGKSFKPPEIYDKWYEIVYPDNLESIKLKRKFKAKLHQENIERNISMRYVDYAARMEYVAIEKSKVLRRELDL